MKTLLKVEEFAQFLVAILLFAQLPYAWWWFPALLLLPDLSMLGYLINTRIGAYAYNVVHHKGLAIAVGAVGLLVHQPDWMLAGIILFAHSCMDRIAGYGLKFTDNFKHTHLGQL